MSLTDIEKLAKDFSEARVTLKTRVMDLEEQMNLLKKKFIPLIKYAVDAAKTRQEKLKVAIEESPQLFEKPKTMTLHGIRIGFQKSRGGLEWEDDAQVVKLIRKVLPDQFDLLVKVKETPVKTALSQLEVAELKKLGISVLKTGDETVIKPTDSEVDKMVTRLLTEQTEPFEDAA